HVTTAWMPSTTVSATRSRRRLARARAALVARPGAAAPGGRTPRRLPRMCRGVPRLPRGPDARRCRLMRRRRPVTNPPRPFLLGAGGRASPGHNTFDGGNAMTRGTLVVAAGIILGAVGLIRSE